MLALALAAGLALYPYLTCEPMIALALALYPYHTGKRDLVLVSPWLMQLTLTRIGCAFHRANRYLDSILGILITLYYIQSSHDSFRLIKYDLAKARVNMMPSGPVGSKPLLKERHNVSPGMFLVHHWLRQQLLRWWARKPRPLISNDPTHHLNFLNCYMYIGPVPRYRVGHSQQKIWSSRSFISGKHYYMTSLRPHILTDYRACKLL